MTQTIRRAARRHRFVIVDQAAVDLLPVGQVQPGARTVKEHLHVAAAAEVNRLQVLDALDLPRETLAQPRVGFLDLVAVLDGTKAVGVVLMTNIFGFVAEFVMEHGADARPAFEKGGDDV